MPCPHECADGVKCKPLCWIATTHVCRRWRNIALCVPSLWSTIDVPVDPEWTAELLRRSGKLPLYVRAWITDTSPESHKYSLELVFGQLHRIRELLYGTAGPLQTSVAKLLAGNAPLLRTVDLRGGFDDPQLPNEPEGGVTMFPALLSADRTPQLESMSLSVFLDNTALPRPFTRNLKNFTLSIPYDGFGKLDLPTVLNILGEMPLLETFHLERRGILEDLRLEEMAHLPIIQLPHLYSIELTSSALECAALLNHLDPPYLLFLSVTAKDTGNDDFELIPALGPKIDTLGSIYRVDIDVDRTSFASPGSLRITGFDSDGPPYGRDSDYAIFEIKLQGYFYPADVIPPLCRHVSLSSVQSLILRATCIDKRSLEALAQAMESLECLIISGKLAHKHLLSALTPSPLADQDGTAGISENAEESDSEQICNMPNLFSLTILRACLNTRAQFEAGDQGPWIEDLCDVLRERADAGCETPLVNIVRCSNVNKAMLSALQDVLDEVDGEVTGEPNEVGENVGTFAGKFLQRR